MNTASEKQADRTYLGRLFRQYNRESALFVIVGITLVAAVISWFRAETAIDDAAKASAQATTWQQMYKETERECRLAQLEIDDLRVAMALAGIELPHDEGSP